MLPLTLQSRRIYILPTSTGYAAAVLLFLMLLAGMNYNNSLALMLCFMLCGVALVSMHQCHRSLAGLQLLRAQAEDVFAGREGEVCLQFENTSDCPRAGLALRCAPCAPSRFLLPPGAIESVRVAFKAGTRGRQRIERLELESTAPLGLFRAWTWLHLPLEAIVYPRPLSARPLPPLRGEQPRLQRSARGGDDEEWAWLRPFHASDPPRSVAWKAYAHGAPLLVAQYEAPAGMHRWLEFDQLRALAPEQRLEQLAQWVLDCERIGEPYALQMPQQVLAASSGRAHRQLCLRALALYGR